MNSMPLEELAGDLETGDNPYRPRRRHIPETEWERTAAASASLDMTELLAPHPAAM